jgi:hypothetical protein
LKGGRAEKLNMNICCARKLGEVRTSVGERSLASTSVTFSGATGGVGILRSCASMRNAPDLRILGTFFTLIVSQGILALSPFIS